MRILLVSAETAPFRGGVAEVVHGLARALHAPPETECTVLGPSRGPELRAGLTYPYRGYLGVGNPRSRLELLGLVARLVPCAVGTDVVVAADVVAHQAFSLLPPWWWRQRRAWLYCHGSEVLLQAHVGRVYRRQRLYAGVDGVLANSRYTCTLVRQHFSPPRLEVAYPGIREWTLTTPRDQRRAEELRSQAGCAGNPLLVCVGRLDRRKGQDTLVRLVAAARRDGWPVGAVLVGEGPDRSRLETLARDGGVAAAVCFAGSVSDADKIAWLDAADLVVQPSRQEGFMVEGLGLAMAEAGARGKTVVSSQHGGIPEVVKHGETGLLVDQGAPVEVWLAAVRRLLADEAERTAMGERARRWVSERFRWERAAKEVRAILGGGG